MDLRIQTVHFDADKKLIEFIEKKTDANKILGLEHSKQLLALGKIQNVEFSFNATIPKRTYQIDPDKTLEEKIGYLCFQLCREYSESMNVRSLPISTILNLRNFEGFDAALVVGDVHSTVVTYFLSTDTLEEFNNRLKNIIAEYLRGNNPYQAAFSSFPKSDDIQQTLEMIYDTNPLISLNYLGYIDDSNLSEQLQNLEKTKNILQAFPATRVYLTAFENSKNEIRVYALNEVSKK